MACSTKVCRSHLQCQRWFRLCKKTMFIFECRCQWGDADAKMSIPRFPNDHQNTFWQIFYSITHKCHTHRSYVSGFTYGYKNETKTIFWKNSLEKITCSFLVWCILFFSFLFYVFICPYNWSSYFLLCKLNISIKSAALSKTIFALREKCSNKELFLVRIFLY